MEEAESGPDPQKPGTPVLGVVAAVPEKSSDAAPASGAISGAEETSGPVPAGGVGGSGSGVKSPPAPVVLPEAELIFGREKPAGPRRRVLNPWLAGAAAVLVMLACGAVVQSPFSMVSAHRVPTSDLPRLSDPAPMDARAVDGGGPSHFELPPVVPAAGVGSASTAPPTTPGAVTTVATLPGTTLPGTAPGATAPAGTRGTTATGTGGIPQTVLSAYQYAASNLARMRPGCKLPWTLLAGIGRVESEHAYGGNVTVDGTAVTPILGPRLDGVQFARITDTDGGRYDFDTQFDRAVGPMQFIPSTWAGWGMDGNGDGLVNPQNVFDATLAAGRYLCAGNRDLSKPAGLDAAIMSYNHSDEYVRTVKSWMTYYATGVKVVPDAPKPAGTKPATVTPSTSKPASPTPTSPKPTTGPKPTPKPTATKTATPKPTPKPTVTKTATPKPSTTPPRSAKPTTASPAASSAASTSTSIVE